MWRDPLKLIIQIPCFNEEQALAATLASLPKGIEGVDEIEVLVIDDGSQDRTAEVAQASGAVVLSLGQHRGLAAGFRAGLKECLARGADIVVNTDADNQYDSRDIPALIQPVVSGAADIVVGDREVRSEEYFSLTKRWLQRVGSWVVSLAAGFKVPDATSGYRAFSRAAAARVVVRSRYSYTLETLIQAGALRQRIAFVPVRTNAPVRPSRLMRSKLEYVRRSAVIIVQSFAIYHPFKTLLSSTGLISGMAIAGLATDLDQMVVAAAVILSLTLLGFAPLYLGHRAALRQVGEQEGKFASSSEIECATAAVSP